MITAVVINYHSNPIKAVNAGLQPEPIQVLHLIVCTAYYRNKLCLIIMHKR